MISVKWKDREITRQPQRFLTALFAATFGVLGALLALVVLFVLLPLSIPFHVSMRAFGGDGFWQSPGKYVVSISWSLFIIAFYTALILLAVFT